MPQWAINRHRLRAARGLSLSAEPRELAANRMLMFSSASELAAIAMSAGAVRSTLVRLQTEAVDVPAQPTATRR